MMTQLDDLVARVRAVEAGESSGDTEALLIDLETAVHLAGGQERLVECFGSSSSATVLRSLSFLLSSVAKEAKPSDLHILLNFVERLDTDDVATLLNALTAFKRHRTNQAIDSNLRARRNALWRLIQLCINQSSDLVRSSVLYYLEQLVEDGQFVQLFKESQFSDVMDKLASWSQTGDDDLREGSRTLLKRMERLTSGEHP